MTAKRGSMLVMSLFLSCALTLMLCADCASAGTSGPVISSISPANGSAQGGQQVTIDGSGFLGPQGSCRSGYAI